MLASGACHPLLHVHLELWSDWSMMTMNDYCHQRQRELTSGEFDQD
jgi:hypothetical protein